MGAGSWRQASPKRLKAAVPQCLWGPSGSALSCTRQGCPTVSGMTVHCHCPASQGRRIAAAPTVHCGGVSEGVGLPGLPGEGTDHLPCARNGTLCFRSAIPFRPHSNLVELLWIIFSLQRRLLKLRGIRQLD